MTTPNKRSQVVHNVQLVKARQFYGFHAEEQVFIKIVM